LRLLSKENPILFISSLTLIDNLGYKLISLVLEDLVNIVDKKKA